VSEVVESRPIGVNLGEWTHGTLGDVLRVRNGYAFKSTDYQTSGVLLVRQSNLGGDRVSVEKAVYLPPELVDQYSEFLVRKGDILIGMSGSIGKLCLYDREEPALQNQRTGLLIFKNDSLRKWVWQYLPVVERQLLADGKGVGVQNVSGKQIEALPLPVAPAHLRESIVADLEKQFSRLDEAVANLQRVKANLKRYKASVLKAAVEGRLVETEATLARREGRTYETGEQLLQRVLLARPDQWSARGRYAEPLPAETKDLSPLPDGWIWSSIDQLSDFITKGTTPAPTKLFDGAGDVQFLKVYNLTFNGSLNHTHKPAYVSRATHKDELARSQVLPGDVLINIVGPPLGQVSVVPAHIEEANINQAIARIRPIKPIGSAFIALALMCDDIMRWAIRRGKTTAGQANLTLELCRALPVPVPPLAEQARIVAEVARHLSIIREVEAEVDANLKRAHALRQSTLAKAFSP